MQKMLHCSFKDRKVMAKTSCVYYFILDNEEVKKYDLHLGDVYEFEIKEPIKKDGI